MGSWPEPKHYECELTESDFLPSISFEKFPVVVHWDYSISSAPFLTELRLWELSLEIWPETSRRWVWQFVNVYYECELIGSDYLPSISFEKFRVGGGWVQWDYNVSSAPFLTELRLWELSLEIWAETSRSRAWQQDPMVLWCDRCLQTFNSHSRVLHKNFNSHSLFFY